MRIEATRRLRGPNAYLDRPVLLAHVHLEELTGRETNQFPGFTHLLLAALPGLAEHHCAAGQPGGFVGRLHGGTYFGHVVEHVAIELSMLIGREINFGRTTAARSGYDLVIECPLDEPPASGLAEDLLRLAIDVVTEVVGKSNPVIGARIAPLRERWERCRPGPSTAALAAAARERGLPLERIDDLSLLRLGHGRNRRLLWAALTDSTSALGVDIAGDKELTRRILAEAAVPVPGGGVAMTAEEAVAIYERLGATPVVVKPRHGRHGTHVYLGLHAAEAVRAAFHRAAAAGGVDKGVIVERQLAG